MASARPAPPPSGEAIRKIERGGRDSSHRGSSAASAINSITPEMEGDMQEAQKQQADFYVLLVIVAVLLTTVLTAVINELPAGPIDPTQMSQLWTPRFD